MKTQLNNRNKKMMENRGEKEYGARLYIYICYEWCKIHEMYAYVNFMSRMVVGIEKKRL